MFDDLFKTRWPNFSSKEVISSDGLLLYAKGIFPLRFSALDKLQLFREKLGVPLQVNHGGLSLRGFRSIREEYNLNLELERDPFTYSMHCAGIAFDVSSPNLTVESLYKEALYFNWGGIGIYDWGVHVDDRDSIARWDMRTIKSPINIKMV